MSTSTPVIVNVGGTRFHTTIETLRNCPGRGDRSIFRHMNISSQEETFVDRDPTAFGYILNYLRDGSIIFPKDRYILALTKYEAWHYGLHYLYNHLPKCDDDLHIVEAEWDSEAELFRSPSYGHSEPSPDTEWMSSPVFPANLNISNGIFSPPLENSQDSNEFESFECDCQNRGDSSQIPPSVHRDYLDDSGSISPQIFTYHRGRIDHE